MSEDEKKKKIEKRDLLLFASLLLVGCFGLFISRTQFSAPAAVVEVAVIDEDSNKTIIEVFDLSEDRSFLIVTEARNNEVERGENRLEISNGEVWISEANCPNRDCIQKGKIHENGDILVCLPHRVTVSITDK